MKLTIRYSTDLEIVRGADKASSIACRERSNTWRCKPDPPAAVGSKSFSPRFGMNERADGAELVIFSRSELFELDVMRTEFLSSQVPGLRRPMTARLPHPHPLQVLGQRSVFLVYHPYS